MPGLTELEQRALQEFRWWTLDALRTTEETVYPERLPDMLAAALAA